jgi:hypothetical protein
LLQLHGQSVAQRVVEHRDFHLPAAEPLLERLALGQLHRNEWRGPLILRRTAYCWAQWRRGVGAVGGAIMRTLLRSTGPAVLSLLLFQPAAGRADPIVISSGTIAGHVLLSVAQLDIQGSGFSFTGALDGFLGNAAACTPCLSPVADLGATLDQFSSGGGTGVIEGVTYPLVYVGFSSGTFTTPTATLTELGSTRGAVHLHRRHERVCRAPADPAFRRASDFHGGARRQRTGIGTLLRPGG